MPSLPKRFDALRAAGIEVWFDKSECAAGTPGPVDSRQIKNCALLPGRLPHHARTAEGYFRLEWKLRRSVPSHGRQHGLSGARRHR